MNTGPPLRILCEDLPLGLCLPLLSGMGPGLQTLSVVCGLSILPGRCPGLSPVGEGCVWKM
jgi:hypothetical protein